jgi:hypothetical protein
MEQSRLSTTPLLSLYFPPPFSKEKKTAAHALRRRRRTPLPPSATRIHLGGRRRACSRSRLWHRGDAMICLLHRRKLGWRGGTASRVHRGRRQTPTLIIGPAPTYGSARRCVGTCLTFPSSTLLSLSGLTSSLSVRKRNVGRTGESRSSSARPRLHGFC